MSDFRKRLAGGDFIIFDGGFGSLLQERGLPPGCSPELFGLEKPEAVISAHADYVAAGAQAVVTNTFGGTRYKLGPGVDVTALNRRMAGLARQAGGDSVLVAGSVGPTGHMVKPLGDVSMRELVGAFKEQITGLIQGGVDALIIETQFDLAEAKAAVLAAREVGDIPVIVSMTFEAGVCLTGTPAAVFAETMNNLGVDVIGTNCGAGPFEVEAALDEILRHAAVPVIVQPNAGLPKLVDGQTRFELGPEEFAAKMIDLAKKGARCLGGCCGTTPAHIAALRRVLSGLTPVAPARDERPRVVLTSRRLAAPVGFDFPCVLIGERINPTGKKKLSEELVAGELAEALRLAAEQTADGASVLDVNVGAPLADETALMSRLVTALTGRSDLPLCLDSNSIEALEAGLWEYPGSPLVNSISGEPGRLERLGPICKAHGAPFILLPLKGRKLPVTAAERLAIIEELLLQAEALGIPRRLIIVDALALTVSSKPEAARACFETIRECRTRWGLGTTLGLSNISFGLPARELVNSTFLSMCMASGLTALIANPSSTRLRETLAAGEVLLNRDPQAGRFIAGFTDWSAGSGGGGVAGPATPKAKAENLTQAVILGSRDDIQGMVRQRLDEGADPFRLLNEELIPGITEVGGKYERREYFLPQLLISAETLQAALDIVNPLLAKASGGKVKTKIVMATVEGDIHDIGKNIVCLMLRNHDFEVIDLGKDVPAERIVEAARAEGAALIGLSALMTTTMVRMRDTVDLVREQGLAVKIMVGGAVVTPDFARLIGADGYSRDAVEAVRVAKDLCGRVQ